MVSSRRLSPRQVEVLGRLVAGESVSRADSDLRVTVYALRNRGLVVTPRQAGGGWVVELTAVGREAASTGRVPERLPRPQGRARAMAHPGVVGPEQAQQAEVGTQEPVEGEAPPARARSRARAPSPKRNVGAVHGGAGDPRGAVGRPPG